MKKYILLIIILLTSICANAQLIFNYSVGYGSFEMGDMKDAIKTAALLPEVINSEMKIVDKFPNYITHSLSMTYQIKQHEFGVKLGYLSTGAKTAYSDYSGKYEEKLVLSSSKVGLVYRNHFYEIEIGDNPFSIFVELSPSATFTDMTAKSELQLYAADIHTKEKEKTVSNEFGFSIQPMLGARLCFLKYVFVNTGVGYDFQFGTKIGPSHRVDWSGLRLDAGVGLMF